MDDSVLAPQAPETGTPAEGIPAQGAAAAPAQGAAAAPAQGAAAAPAQGAAAAPAWGAAAAPAWVRKCPEEVKAWLGKLNLNDPVMVAQKAYHQERLLGADKAGRAVLLPKDEKDEAAFNAIYDKLGRPSKPEEYQLPVPEGQPGDLAKEFAPIMHKLGLTKAQAVGLTQAWNEKVATMMQQDAGVSAQEQQLQINELKQSLGSEFNAYADRARIAVKTLGVTGEQAAAIEKGIGIAAAVKLFAAIGKMMEEPGMIRDTTRSPQLGMTPEGAKMRISELMADKDWARAYVSGDKNKLAEFERLQKISLGLA